MLLSYGTHIFFKYQSSILLVEPRFRLFRGRPDKHKISFT